MVIAHDDHIMTVKRDDGTYIQREVTVSASLNNFSTSSGSGWFSSSDLEAELSVSLSSALPVNATVTYTLYKSGSPSTQSFTIPAGSLSGSARHTSGSDERIVDASISFSSRTKPLYSFAVRNLLGLLASAIGNKDPTKISFYTPSPSLAFTLFSRTYDQYDNLIVNGRSGTETSRTSFYICNATVAEEK